MPDYNPFWEEPEYKNQPDYWKWYHFGYDVGHQSYAVPAEDTDKLIKENEALKALIEANIRLDPKWGTH